MAAIRSFMERDHYPEEHLTKVPCPIAQREFCSVGMLWDLNRGPPDLESSALPSKLVLLL